MPKFQKYGNDFVYTDEYGGSLYLHGEWLPFRYFDNGEIDILSDEKFSGHEEAFLKYKEIYT